MRNLIELFAIGWLVLVPSFSSAAGPFDGDRKDSKDGADEIRLWQAWLRQLGNGPVYRVEILYRDRDDGQLYLCQAVVSVDQPRFGPVQGLGVNPRGQVLPPPDPGHERVQKVADVVRAKDQPEPPPPLALTTHYLGVSIDRKDAQRGTADIQVSDQGTSMLLPARPGQATVAYFGDNAFYIEMLTAEEVARLQPLRQDPRYFHRRTATLQRELLTTHRALLAEPHNLTEAAVVLRDPALINQVRKALAVWNEQTRDEAAGKGFPNDLCRALAQTGGPEDFKLFQSMARRHPDYASHVAWPALDLVRRVGGAEAGPLVSDLLNDRAPGEGRKTVQLLRKLDRTVPERTAGDEVLIEMVRAFKLKPGDYGLRLAQGRLLELTDRYAFTPQELRDLKQAVENQSGDWVMLSDAGRRRGVQKALDWLRTYKPAKNADEAKP